MACDVQRLELNWEDGGFLVSKVINPLNTMFYGYLLLLAIMKTLVYNTGASMETYVAWFVSTATKKVVKYTARLNYTMIRNHAM